MDVAAADVLLPDSWIRTVRVASGSRPAARVASLRRVVGQRPACRRQRAQLGPDEMVVEAVGVAADIQQMPETAAGPSRSAREAVRTYRGVGIHE